MGWPARNGVILMKGGLLGGLAIAVAVVTVVTPAWAAQGLRGEFYRDLPDQWGAFGSDGSYPQPYWRGVSPNIDFVFASDADQYFSARWTGYLLVPESMAGSITFKTVTDDGVRLIIDGQTIIDFWRLQAHQTIGTPNDECTHTATVTLDAGYHTIVFEYFEWEGGPDDPDPCQLYWNDQIIPSDYLFTEIPPSGNLAITDVSHSPSTITPAAGESCTITYTITEAATVLVEILDPTGSNTVRQLPAAGGQWQEAGEHSVVWDGKDDAGNVVSPGVYPYRIKATNDSGTAVYDPGAEMPNPVDDLTRAPYGDGVYFCYTIKNDPGAKVRIRIGVPQAVVRTLVDWAFRSKGFHNTDYWDYRDESGYRVPAGDYMAAIWTIPAARNGIVVK